MRQNQNIKVEEARNAIELLECDSSDISECHTLLRVSTQRDYIHEQVLRLRPKLALKAIDLASEHKDADFFVYTASLDSPPTYVLSRLKQVKSDVLVNSVPFKTRDSFIYLAKP